MRVFLGVFYLEFGFHGNVRACANSGWKCSGAQLLFLFAKPQVGAGWVGTLPDRVYIKGQGMEAGT